MLKFKKNNNKYIWWMVTVGLCGIVGLLLVPIFNYIIKLVNRYPKLFKWVFIIVYICGVLFIENWSMRLALICIGVAITSNKLSTDNR